MANRLDTSWLSYQMKEYMASAVTYSRGETIVSVMATIGRSQFGVARSDGVASIEHVRDYQVDAADLGLKPRRGDRITEADGTVYEVNAPDGASDVWEWVDSFRRTMRIHTRKV